jgi:hypothetical protein
MRRSSWLQLSVGPIGMDLGTDNALLRDGLRARYHGFEGEAPTAVTLTFTVRRGTGPPSAGVPRAEVRAGTLRFAGPALRGTLEPHAATAELELAAADAVAAADYAVRSVLALAAFQRGGLLLHAAGIAARGQAIAFFGHSGCGKTTIARLAHVQGVLSDDLVLLQPDDGTWWAHATPFWSMARPLVRPCSPAPLSALYRLRQDRITTVEPLAGARALAELAASSPVVNADPQQASALLARCAALSASVPVRELRFRPDAGVWTAVGAPSAAAGADSGP